jgi:hypothetical protein
MGFDLMLEPTFFFAKFRHKGIFLIEKFSIANFLEI